MRKSGFTLIELSIALVIIGLLVGGVLVGRDLIKAAELRSQVSDIERYNVAVNTFELKYDCLPGDCANATNFFGASSQPERVYNGNGNGIISGYSSASGESVPDKDYLWHNAAAPYDMANGDTRAEFMEVFDHLAAAKLVSMSQYDQTTSFATYAVPGVAFPELRVKSIGQGPLHWLGVYDVQNQGGLLIGHEPAMSYIPGGNKIRLGACPSNPAAFTCGINPWEAHYIDTKLDDGKPFSGLVVITAQIYIFRAPGNPWGEGWYNYCDASDESNMLTAGNVYRSENNIVFWGGSPVHRMCALSIKAQF